MVLHIGFTLHHLPFDTAPAVPRCHDFVVGGSDLSQVWLRSL